MSREPGRSRGGGRGRGDFSLPFRGGRGGRGGGGDRGRGFDAGRGGGGRGRGGGAPVQVDAFSQGADHPPVVDPEITRIENDTEKSIQGFKSTQVDFPLRPGYGTLGRAVVLWANYFKFVSDNNMTLYRYSIELRPQGHQRVPAGKIAKRIVQLFLEEHFLPDSKDIATDFKANLISKHEIEIDETGYTVTYRAEEEDEPATNAKQYRINLQFTGTYTTTELINHLTSSQAGSILQSKEELIQALNIIIGHYPKATQTIVNVGSNRHFNRDAQDSISLGGGLRAIRGFLVSVRAVTARLLMNVQVKNFAVYDHGPLDAVIQSWRAQNGENAAGLSRFLSKLSIHLTHLERKSNSGRRILRIKKIAGLATTSDGQTLTNPPRVPRFGANAREVEFYLNSSEESSTGASKPAAGGGKKGKKAPKPGPAQPQRDPYISVYDYFKQTYNITIQNPQQPVINVGSRQMPSYLPAQVCEVMPGQPATAKLSPAQTQSMIRFAVRKPVENARSVVSSGGELLGFEPTNETLNAFGANARPRLIAVPGRVLPNPNVKYAGPNETPTQFGSWNMRNVQFVSKARMPSWTFLRIELQGLGSPWSTDQEFLSSVNQLGDVLRQQGIEAAQYMAGRKLVIAPQTFEKQIDDAVHAFAVHPKRPGMVLVVIPERQMTAVYNRVKYACDVKEGLLNVCVLDSKFKNNNIQYLANVSLKFNLKLGGRNHSINPSKMGIISEKKTMVVGIDVTHPSPGSAANAPSVAGMVASVDELLGQWPADLRIQTARQEMVDDLDGMLKSRLKLWQKKNNNALPENILVYRDGVSEGQYSLVLEHELPKLRKACEDVYPATSTKSNKPRITIIVVGKRHNTRFYPTKKEDADRSGNPQNGTIVDRGVTEARNWDFFLQAHTALQGTARPAHYYIVYDQILREQKVQPPFTSAADALENLTHNMCYLFGRATKAVSICPPAYYADLVCERARLYLKEYFDPTSAAESTSGASTASLPDANLVTIHENIRDLMFYI